MMDLKQIREVISRKTGERDLLTRQLNESVQKLEEAKELQQSSEKAVEIIQVVAQATQKQLEYHISEVVTLALSAVFPRPYKFVVNFCLKRNRTEAELALEDDEGNQVSPMDATGGGVVDIASFALRIAMLGLRKGRLRQTIILDEPFRFLSSDLQDKAGEMLKEISERLGLQFIVITHRYELLETADRIFYVSNENGVSKVSEK